MRTMPTNANEHRYRFQLCNLITQNSTKFLYSDPEPHRLLFKSFLFSAANEVENLIAHNFQYMLYKNRRNKIAWIFLKKKTQQDYNQLFERINSNELKIDMQCIVPASTYILFIIITYSGRSFGLL